MTEEREKRAMGRGCRGVQGWDKAGDGHGPGRGAVGRGGAGQEYPSPRRIAPFPLWCGRAKGSFRCKCPDLCIRSAHT